eukprot:TRINITY_DN44155_c0_g1_i1.p1 TRINITY_DN44155_c0_g1~~TRINITY_DN44155_c0_g1_i1.p1  ORF type:complete len:576 (+),score=188.49 TRINITY_DN44155_c0_g1_i1:127-1854(+)
MSIPPGSSRGMASRAGMGSSYGQQAGVGVGLQTQVQVQARPVTSQGMKGMTSSYGGAVDRQVKDRTYWMAKLREKNTQLQAEIERLQQKKETLESGAAGRAELDRRKSEVVDSVAEMRVNVGGYNYAIDAVNQGKDLPAVEKAAAAAEKEARRLANAVDDAFRERQQRQKETDNATEQLGTLEREIEGRVASEAPQSVDEFRKYREQLRELMAKVEPLQTELEGLSRQAAEKQAKLKATPAKVAAVQLRERKADLEKEKKRLMDEIARSDTGMLKDEKTRLFEQVQADTRELELKQKMVSQKKGAIEASKELVKQLESRLAEYRDDKAEQFRQLEAKDREMTEFMDRFDSAKEHELQEIAKAEEMIVDLLEHISKNIAAKQHMPDQQRLAAMVDDVKFKQQQAAYAETTHEHLLSERESRLKELERVDTLDQKISEGLKTMNEKIAKEEGELVIYGDLDGLRKRYEGKRKAALTRKSAMIAHRDALKQRVSLTQSGPFDKLQKRLKEDEVWESLHTLEGKVRQKRVTAFELSDFIAQKAVETDYSALKTDCLKAIDSINTRLKELQLTRPRSIIM